MNHCPSRNMLQLLKTTAIYKQEFVISSDITVGGICPLKIIAQGGDCTTMGYCELSFLWYIDRSRFNIYAQTHFMSNTLQIFRGA